MRIISGKHKGKRLVAPKNLPVRPTADMQKEALFNILNNHFFFQEIQTLDLFSGTGNIAYEFASRGCKDVVAVDAHYGCVKFISKTSKELDFAIQSVRSDVFRYLKKTNFQFDIIFADPPYALEQSKFENIPNIVFERKLLLKNGLLIIEHGAQTNLSHLPHFKEQRKYGSSVFSFFVTL